jgi:hypothetical protein
MDDAHRHLSMPEGMLRSLAAMEGGEPRQSRTGLSRLCLAHRFGLGTAYAQTDGEGSHGFG